MKFRRTIDRRLVALAGLAILLIFACAAILFARQSSNQASRQTERTGRGGDELANNCFRLGDFNLARTTNPDTPFCLPETKGWGKAPAGDGAAAWQAGSAYLTLNAAEASGQELGQVIRVSANELKKDQHGVKKIEARLSGSGLVGVMAAEIGQTNTIYLAQVWVRDPEYHVDLIVTVSDSKPIDKMAMPAKLFPG